MSRSFYVPMRIASIRRIKKEVVVYNLAVEDDESYVLNGIVSHNCRCLLAPATDDIPDRPDDGEKDFEEWLET